MQYVRTADSQRAMYRFDAGRRQVDARTRPRPSQSVGRIHPTVNRCEELFLRFEMFLFVRRGHDVLQADLPPKTEYVILLKLTPYQRQLYMKFLEAVGVLTATTEKTFNPLRAFAICCKVKLDSSTNDFLTFLLEQIWNHADVLYKFVRDRQDGADLDLDFDLEQNANRTGTPAGKSRAKSTAGNAADSPSTSLTMEKKEFDYDFVRSLARVFLLSLRFRLSIFRPTPFSIRTSADN